VFDLLLEHALRDELAPTAPASTADLASRVTAALAGIDARRSPMPPMPPMPPSRHVGDRSPRSWLPFAITAAAGVAVALTWLAAKPSGFSCSRALLFAAADDQPFAASTRVAAASFAWCTGDEAVELTAGDGTVAIMAPGCALAIDPQRRRAELVAGAMELRGRRAPWRVGAHGMADVAVFVGDGCTVRCSLTSETFPRTDPTDPNMTPNDLRARLRNLAVSATFTVLVLAGNAEVATAQGKEVLPAGSSRTIAASDERDVRARTRQLFDAARKELPRPTDEVSTAAWKEQEDRFHELVDIVLQRPAAAAMLRQPLSIELGNARLAAGPRARMLQLALLDEDAGTFAAATQVWELHSDTFGFEEQVALAERGFAPAKAKLRELLAQSRGLRNVRVFAALASGGDDTARAALPRFLAANVADASRDIQRFDARCHAAVAMQSLGDPAPVRELRTALIAQVETWVASGDAQQLALADSCLQRAEYWLATQQPRLSWPELRQRAAAKHRGEPDAASVRARAAALASK